MAVRDKIDAWEFRRISDKSTWGYRKWHFCRNCSKWPSRDYEEIRWRPRDHEICVECKRHNDRGNCNSTARWL